MPASRRTFPTGEVISQFSIRVVAVCRSLIPTEFPSSATATLRTVTPFAPTSTGPLTEKPSNTVPAPSIVTRLPSQCQPAPLVTLAGTARSATPALMPVLEASGYPQALGRAAQPVAVTPGLAGAAEALKPLVEPLVTLPAVPTVEPALLPAADFAVGVDEALEPALGAAPGASEGGATDSARCCASRSCASRAATVGSRSRLAAALGLDRKSTRLNSSHV